MVFRLIYTAIASPDLTAQDIQDILRSSQKNNALTEVTGVLLFHDATFLQVLEGPKDTVKSLVRTIDADPRKQGLFELFEEETRKRLFPDWSMAYVPMGPNLAKDVLIEGSFKLIARDPSAVRKNDDNIVHDFFQVIAHGMTSGRYGVNQPAL